MMNSKQAMMNMRHQTVKMGNKGVGILILGNKNTEGRSIKSPHTLAMNVQEVTIETRGLVITETVLVIKYVTFTTTTDMTDVGGEMTAGLNTKKHRIVRMTASVTGTGVR